MSRRRRYYGNVGRWDQRALRADRLGVPGLFRVGGRWTYIGTLAPHVSAEKKAGRNAAARAWVEAANQAARDDIEELHAPRSANGGDGT